MKNINICGYAKINLHLDVVGRMENGYHEVETVMQTVSICDDLTLTLLDTEQIYAQCDREGVPADEKNLAVRAALLFRERANRTFGLRIEIVKRIPMAAGMAGGSADAAATLVGLNRLLDEPLSWSELLEIGSRLGADVPFCMAGGTAFADGKGDLLHDFPAMPDCYLVIACEGEGVSTPWAYGQLDRAYDDFAKKGSHVALGVAPLREAMEGRDLAEISASLFNIFEAPVLAERPVAAELRRILLASGALGAMMSGSGPSVFGIFADEMRAKDAYSALEAVGAHPYLCRPVSKF